MVGLKGFVGGFPDSRAARLRRAAPARGVRRDDGGRGGARARAGARSRAATVRLVLLHYAPTTTTLEGEPRGIWAFLGSDRLARPIADHWPDLVLHGHAHAGTFEGFIGRVPVYNVATPLTGRDFAYFDLGGDDRPHAEPQRPAEARAE